MYLGILDILKLLSSNDSTNSQLFESLLNLEINPTNIDNKDNKCKFKNWIASSIVVLVCENAKTLKDFDHSITVIYMAV